MRESAYIAEIDLKALRPVYGKVPTSHRSPGSRRRPRPGTGNEQIRYLRQVEKAIAEASSFVSP